MKSAYCLMLAALAVTASVCSAQSRPVGVRKDHPRIYVTRETLAALKAKVNGPGKQTFDRMRTAGWIMKEKPGTEYSDQTNMAYPAFCWLVTGEKHYLQQAKAYLAAVADKPPADQYKTPEFLRAAAMVYDWTFNDLTDAERKRFAAALVTMAEYCAKLWRHSDFNNHFVNESLAVLWAGVALANDDVDDAAGWKFLKLGGEHLVSAAAGANESAGGDGGQFEGFSYNDWGYARPLAYTFEMWRTATAEDLFARSTFFKTQAAWHVYCLRPDNDTFERAEDCPSGFAPGEHLKNILLLAAARCNDPLAQWLADRIERKYVQNLWMDLLWRDDSLAGKSPKELNLPTVKLFSRLGWVAMRSAWEDPNATFALFQCGPFFAGHQHADANSFVIHKAGSLAIDSGTNDYGPHRGNYYARTIAHNTILVHDPNERFSGSAWGGKDAGGSNDGGQLRPPAIDRAGEFKPLGPSDVGRIIAFRTGPTFTYIAGDATRAYSPVKLKDFTRQLFYLPPDVFVVYDRVDATRGTFAKTWLLHSISEPNIGRSGSFSVAHRKGTLLGQVFLPLQPRIQVVGGPGREYFVNGRNYPPTKPVDPESGSWRIEVAPSPARPRLNHDFLVVLTACGPGQLEMPPCEGGGDEEKLEVNLELTLKYIGREYRFSLRRTGDMGGRLLIREGGKTLEQADLSAGIR